MPLEVSAPRPAPHDVRLEVEHRRWPRSASSATPASRGAVAEQELTTSARAVARRRGRADPAGEQQRARPGWRRRTFTQAVHARAGPTTCRRRSTIPGASIREGREPGAESRLVAKCRPRPVRCLSPGALDRPISSDTGGAPSSASSRPHDAVRMVRAGPDAVLMGLSKNATWGPAPEEPHEVALGVRVAV
jgi:hypothetical protein